ncbi:putative 28S rRNA (Cytosine-C(5))-methyltransferase [Heracleum sosnowskyi]|uniref:28S rRNA (Cytosine-C(5))-methyltransferase n=1 Tax=Heracleum sosnowskyi TaxID=360622 RepID=A0AAD8HZ82_9APIA|nr:putative 28S rRNA (Cytosine-C(5))-methyltransferase [Heracleum sosnowskyi]
MQKPNTNMPPVTKQKKTARLSNAEKSSFFARREAAKVLTSVLDGDARRQAAGSIKSLVFKPSVRNKKATFALVCQTLKCLPYIKEILESSDILNNKWKKQQALMYLITYDILFGQNVALVGDAEKFLQHKKDALLSALAQILVKNRVKNAKDLMALRSDVSKPRYVRVNTLKLNTKAAAAVFRKRHKVQKDDLVPDLLLLPPGTDLHDHQLVKNGSVLLQGKASSMVAVALDPKPGWEVLDACSAPGNKTVHLAALMRGEGKIIACELNKERVKRLECTIKQAGATNVEVLHGDFLKLSPVDPSYSKVRAILVDPSCSGSGTAVDRLDHLLPSYQTGHVDQGEMHRLSKLAAFQKMALEHALSFPGVERIVYSTCSIHQIENEDVINSVLPFAISRGFKLGTPFPQWTRRGLPVIEESEQLLRTDPVEDKEGFFIALFVRSISQSESLQEREIGNHQSAVVPCKISERKVEAVNKSRLRSSCFFPSISLKMSRVLLNPYFDVWNSKSGKYQH